MRTRVIPNRFFSVGDAAVLLLVGIVIYGVVSIATEWRSDFRPVTEIDLSLRALPYYTLLSGVRGFVAYGFSLGFTLVVGYAAARSRRAERILIPLLDICQSIPVLGFLPGLVLGLVALFPHSNMGLELAAILMIFTGQVWNMTFAFYSSLKSIPPDLTEASTVMNLSRLQKLKRVELPYSAINLAWNSLLSIAGGWFFLIPCESMRVGTYQYRLPGIGAYMEVAVNEGNNQAIISAVISMILLIVFTDFVFWRPILTWVQKFRLEDSPDAVPEETALMRVWIRESFLVRWLNQIRHQIQNPSNLPILKDIRSVLGEESQPLKRPLALIQRRESSQVLIQLGQVFLVAFYFLVTGIAIWGLYRLGAMLLQVPFSVWLRLIRDSFWTFLRVIAALSISTLWTVPVGIWLATSPRRIRVAQPLIQIFASFPMPMIYPLALALCFWIGIPFDWAAMILMFMGVQWYVLFNVLAGAARIPSELRHALSLMETSTAERWKVLYLPSIFPSLVTGWVSAAGGAWNASVLAEYFTYNGNVLQTGGLGADINMATAEANFPLLAASITLMVGIVVLLNRTVWSKIYYLAQTRYRLDI